MSTEQLAQAPNFTLEHALGHTVSLSDFRGRRVVVVFGSRNTTEQVKNGVLTVRRGAGADQVAVVTVLDLHGVPRPARKLVKSQLKKRYDEITAELASSGGGEVNMLVDWSGEVVGQYGMSADEQAAAAVIDPQGRIIGYGAGDQLGAQVLGVLSSN